MLELDCKLDHILSVSTRLSPPEMIGPAPDGIRANFYIVGGEAHGPRIRAKILPVGGDWATVRRDGVGLVDARSTLETADGALIFVTCQGIADFGEDGYARFLRGDLPSTLQLQATPRYYAAHPGYQWLNRLHCIGVGIVDMARLEAGFDVFALRKVAPGQSNGEPHKLARAALKRKGE